MFKRPFFTSVASVVLAIQSSTSAFADSVNYVLLAKADNSSHVQKIYTEKPESEWGWWSKYDWKSYKRSGISKRDMKMLKTAAKYGNAQAQYVLGVLYSTEENLDKAGFWLGKAARQGHTNAKFVYNYMNTSDELMLGC